MPDTLKLLPFALFFAAVLGFAGCTKPSETRDGNSTFFIKGVDLSLLEEVRRSGTKTYNTQDVVEDMLTTLLHAGINTVRIRLWKDPATTTGSLGEVKQLAAECHAKGLKVMLCVHYSDSWADPSQQTTPKAWQTLSTSQLHDSVAVYTQKVVEEIHPDFIQIGNEINEGFLWPTGSIGHSEAFKGLLTTAIAAVRKADPDTKIILHFAGQEQALAFFSLLSTLDFDIAGLSYYPMWHGKSLALLQANVLSLANKLHKPVAIVETAYPFTLGWDDYTNNILGLPEQLIENYPASPEGQKNFLLQISQLSADPQLYTGYCYWGGEWISYQGDTATNGSPWENQALWNFDDIALPAQEVFGQ